MASLRRFLSLRFSSLDSNETSVPSNRAATVAAEVWPVPSSVEGDLRFLESSELSIVAWGIVGEGRTRSHHDDRGHLRKNIRFKIEFLDV